MAGAQVVILSQPAVGRAGKHSEASQPPHGLPPVDGILRFAQNDRVAATTGFFALPAYGGRAQNDRVAATTGFFALPAYGGRAQNDK